MKIRVIEKIKTKKSLTLSELTNFLQDLCHLGKSNKEVFFEDSVFDEQPIKNIKFVEENEKIKLIFNAKGE